MSDLFNIADFMEPLQESRISLDEPYHHGQIGKDVLLYGETFPDLRKADIVLLSCDEFRGQRPGKDAVGHDAVRREFYRLYDWHQLRIADIGQVRRGATLADTYAAVKTVMQEIDVLGKTAILLGGSHDLTLAQYRACSASGRMIEAVCVDARMDLDMNSPARADHFLMEMLTGDPIRVRHYSHVGFQSYLVHPRMLETLDKLRFDCFRVGKVRENMEEMEPVFRQADMVSFDLCALAGAFFPGNPQPNGFTGEDACALMRFAGGSVTARSIGIYGYEPARDPQQITARQIGQMIWYFLEGRSRGSREGDIRNREGFNEFHIAFGDMGATFLQSKRTGRWWMGLPDNSFIPCTYNDYLLASSNEIPERWLRAQERNA